MDPRQLDHSLHIAPVLQYVGDDVVVRMVLVEIQLFKGVENCFTDSLPYKESFDRGKIVHKNV